MKVQIDKSVIEQVLQTHASSLGYLRQQWPGVAAPVLAQQMEAASSDLRASLAEREKRREHIARRAQADAALALVIVLLIGFVVAMLDVLIWRV
jgi:hypothetical protein